MYTMYLFMFLYRINIYYNTQTKILIYPTNIELKVKVTILKEKKNAVK